ncbi:efflux RND transporter permease subunit [Flavobacteriales bacterium]|nr:efflux RND transporter permease subunit [Flavobacteriales bacterium]
MLNSIIKFFLENKLFTFILLILTIVWGLVVAPFDWDLKGLSRDPIAVDAIPDIGENQQIVFTKWPGRSPQDVEDQVSYPLTTALLGIPGVKTIRSSSMFGVSSIYVIFEEDIEFYWSRSRILEKLNALPNGLLPADAKPALGPDATALGQIFWYTLQVQDSNGNSSGGFDLQELRSIQDYQVKYALSSAKGVSEVASIGGFVKEYQIEVDPLAMKNYGIALHQVMKAVKESNKDIGAKTIEINKAEYLVRGLGYIQSLSDIEEAVIKVVDFVPIKIKDVAKVAVGPAERRGILDLNGMEAVGGVVVARYGENPLKTIQNVKKKIIEIEKGLPSRKLSDGREVSVKIVPFYDRTELIQETLGTLEEALILEIIITILVIIIMLKNLKASIIISSILPVSILMVFISMKLFGVDANIVALSGIAIAIGTMVDLGIILTENVVKQLKLTGEKYDYKTSLKAVYKACSEVSGAIITAVLTTIISFLPVFTMTAAEGKLFGPLAFTKTSALIAALIISLFVLPSIAHLLMGKKKRTETTSKSKKWVNWLFAALISYWLTKMWMPFGLDNLFVLNWVFVAVILLAVLGLFQLLIKYYERILRWCLNHKVVFLSVPTIIIVIGIYVFTNTGKEFMPALNEGSFLLMPSTMPHTGVEENQRVLQNLDANLSKIPEVKGVLGKIGRVNSALDPAPVSMFENVILYHPEYSTDENGERVRNWREHIKSPDDIWQEILSVSNYPGLTSSPKLQPIETRLVMLQTGMRAPMGIKILGPDLESIQSFGYKLESILKGVKGVKAEAVFADRMVGKPYLLVDIDRQKIARYGLSIQAVQMHLKTAVGGTVLGQTVEGRERYSIKVRYPRELRNNPEKLKDVLITTKTGIQIPLGDLAEIKYQQGPQVIKSENSFLIGYVLFDKKGEISEVEVVENAQAAIDVAIQNGELKVPNGISYSFTGTYENQVRAFERLILVSAIALVIIFLVLYLQFRSVATALMVFVGILVAFSGGFMMMGLYGTDWFMNIDLLGQNLRDVFQINTIYLSVAVGVGFIALFGIATDDGVVMATYLKQQFKESKHDTVEEVRDTVVKAGLKRIRPCLMTTATTLLALLPILTSSGRGADIMIPMAIPTFGGMTVAMITLFVVPVLYSIKEESLTKKTKNETQD